jgi:hypothetical protein
MMQHATHSLYVAHAARAAGIRDQGLGITRKDRRGPAASLGHAFVLTTLLAAGCAVGPDFKAP